MHRKKINRSTTSLILFLIFQSSLFPSDGSPETFLLKPDGKYNIGAKKFFFIDSTRIDKLSNKKKYREIYIKIWYPVEKSEKLNYDLYLLDYPVKVLADIFSSNGLVPELLEQYRKMNTFTTSNLEIKDVSTKFPVIIFNPGFYFGIADFYTSLIENLASNGYIVCCINHPYEQPYVETSNGSVLLKKKKAQLAYFQYYIADKLQFRKPTSKEKTQKITLNYLRKLKLLNKANTRWTKDSQFFIDYITKIKKNKNNENIDDVFKIMDLEKIGALGQSLGGAVSGQLCAVDPRFKAGINMDCFQFGDIINKPLNVPFMVIQSEHYPKWNLGNSVIFENSNNNFYRLTIKNAKHFVFSDAALITLIDEKNKSNLIGKIDGKASMQTINNYILSFFNIYLLNKKTIVLNENKDNSTIKFEILN